MAELQQDRNEITLLRMETGLESSATIELDKSTAYVYECELFPVGRTDLAVIDIYGGDLEVSPVKIITFTLSSGDQFGKSPSIPPIHKYTSATISSKNTIAAVNCVIRKSS
jgi:hypothetical protein